MNPEVRLVGKRAEIPRIKVQPERKARWVEAYEMALNDQPDLSFADFVRRAMDAYATKVSVDYQSTTPHAGRTSTVAKPR